MPPLDYLTFDLLIEARTAGYRARVVASPAGEAKDDFDLAPFNPVTDVQTTGAALFGLICAGAASADTVPAGPRLVVRGVVGVL